MAAWKKSYAALPAWGQPLRTAQLNETRAPFDLELGRVSSQSYRLVSQSSPVKLRNLR